MKYSIVILLFLISGQIFGQKYFQTETGEAKFLSDAPLEVIRAQSNNLRGIIDAEKNNFAFKILINTFEGFNSPLQQEHFNENYMESAIFPEATFSGKIIEKDALSQSGEVTIRAKGRLQIHGVEEERIIKCKLFINDDTITIRSFFTIFLEDHNIRIPKIVFQKISKEIQVNINAELILTE